MESVKKQIVKYENKIKTEKGMKDTTKEYWRKEIDKKFVKQLKDDANYLEEHE